jgi:hypothetical protein
MSMTNLFRGVVFSFALLASASLASAGAPDDAPDTKDKPAADAKPEPDAKAVRDAKDRYARGMHRFENGDYRGALADFEHAQEIIPSRLLLYRIAMVYVAMEKPADAIDALDEVLSASGSLKPEYLDRAKAAKEEQQRLCGEVDVKVNVPAALVVDGEHAGDAPLKAPLRVAAGEHVVTAVAAGHAPARQSVTVAASGRAELAFELKPTEGKLAQVTVHSPLLGAEVRLDDELIGKTPITEPVAVLPGKHVFELQRTGYMAARRTVNLTDGVYATVAFDPDEESSHEGGRGEVKIEAGAGATAVTIDGRSRGSYEHPIDLPPGLHVVKLERKGFESLEQVVDVPVGGQATIRVALRPTGKIRTAAAEHAKSYKRWALAAMISGAVIAGGSTGLALWSNSKLPAAEDSLTVIRNETLPGQPCNPSEIGNNDVVKQLCEDKMSNAQNKVDKYRNLRLGGIIGATAGAAVAGLGVALWVMAPADPEASERDDLLAGTLVPAVSAGPNGGALWLRGSF